MVREMIEELWLDVMFIFNISIVGVGRRNYVVKRLLVEIFIW